MNVFNRQSNPQLVSAIRELSRCELSVDTSDFLHSLKRPLSSDSEPIHLFGTNYEVDLHNTTSLGKIKEKEALYAAKDRDVKPKFERACPVPKNLKLKKTAKVMLCHTFSKSFCSGMLGTVLECTADSVSVKFENGMKTLKRETFSYSGISGVREQFPLRLAFGLTVHRAQGLTLDAVVVHAAKMSFAGQLGVAIGRVKTVEGLQVVGFSSRLKIESQKPEVINYYIDSRQTPCSCHLPEEQKLSQDTMSAVSSQELSQDVDELNGLSEESLEFYCKRKSDDNKGSMEFNKARDMLKTREDQLKAFAGFVSRELQKTILSCKNQEKMTNKKETSIFAKYHTLITSQQYERRVQIMFGVEPTKYMRMVACSISSKLRDSMIEEKFPVDESMHAFQAAPPSDVSLANVKYVAGYCLFKARQRKQRAVMKSLKSKASKIDPQMLDYSVKLLDSLDDSSIEPEYNEEIERKQYKDGHLFCPNKDTLFYFNFLNEKLREHETTYNVETVGAEFYPRLKKEMLELPEVHERFSSLFTVIDDHAYLHGEEDHTSLHMNAVESILEECLDLLINTSGRSFRKEYVRQKGVQKEEAKRKQIRMKSGSSKSRRQEIAPTANEEVVEASDDTWICGECKTVAGEGTICCDKCDIWHHYVCVNLTEEEAQSLKTWFCQKCVAKI